MKIHLKVIYGCDDRYSIAKYVPELCHKYVDSITIYNCGVRKYTDKFNNLPSNCFIEYFDGFMGDMESVLRGLMQSVPEGDWFMWLDSDEIPSQLLLDNIRKDTEYLESNGYNACRIPSIGHENGLMWQDLSNLPTAEVYFSGKHTTYAARKYIKKDNLYITSNFGAHYDFWSANGDKCYYSPHYVNHLKSKAQVGQAAALRAYTNPLVDYRFPSHREILDSPEVKRLREFQRETGVITSNQLVDKVNVQKDAKFIESYTRLLESFKNSSIAVFNTMSTMLTYGINFDTIHYPCNRPCCKYNEIQL